MYVAMCSTAAMARSRLTAPPPALLDIVRGLERTEDYAVLAAATGKG